MLTIDGSPIAEVDVHASALQILAGYSETKFTLPDVSDLYQAGQLQNLNREVIKTLVQVALNSSKSLLAREYWPKSITDDEEKKALIEGDGIPWTTYGDELAHTYPALTKLPNDFGMRLFRVESDIIVQAMLKLLEVEIGCLSVHDCLVVSYDKVDEAKKAFADACAQFGFKASKAENRLPSVNQSLVRPYRITRVARRTRRTLLKQLLASHTDTLHGNRAALFDCNPSPLTQYNRMKVSSKTSKPLM